MNINIGDRLTERLRDVAKAANQSPTEFAAAAIEDAVALAEQQAEARVNVVRAGFIFYDQPASSVRAWSAASAESDDEAPQEGAPDADAVPA